MSAFRRTIFIAVLGLALVGTAVSLASLSGEAAATAGAGQAESPQVGPPGEPAASQAGRVQELTDLRTATSKTFELADGKMEWVGYGEAVHYKDSTGAFQEIDDSIVSDQKQIDGTTYAFRNGANAFTARFGADAADTRLIRLDYQGASIAFGPAGATASTAGKTADVKSQALADMTYGESLVKYPEIYPGIDLFYELKTYGIKEYLLIKEPRAQNEFTFDLSLEGLTAKQAGGQITFVSEKGETLFYLGEPLAVDEAGVATKDVSYGISGSGSICRLTVTVSRAYLEDAERLYPVVVDPSLMITGNAVTYDSYVSSRYPNTNYVYNTYLRTGRDDPYYVRRTYLRFDLSAAAGINPNDITAAYIRIKKYSGATPVITAYRNTGSWSSGTITWNNKPSYTTSECSTQATNDAGTSWWRMYNLTVVKKWLNGTYSQYGWMIKDATESGTTQWTTFYACDAPSPNKPELHIEYTESDPPVFRPPAYTYHDSGCIGDASDPINILFGGFVGDGYFGTLQGVIDGVTGSDGMWYEVTNYVPGIVPYQYVKFVPTSGSAVIRSNARSLGTGLLSDRYHMRLFLNPFACSCGYANKNTVTAAHHEDWTGSGHEIDQHWEQVEYYVCYRLHDLYQDNTWFDDIAYNGGYSVQGWSSNGYYSVMYLAP